LGVELVPREKTALAVASTRDLEAYDLYLRGLERVNRSATAPDLFAALSHFEAAAKRDPRFPQALLLAAKTHLQIWVLFLDRSREHVDRAREAVDALVRLGPELPETYVARAYYTYWVEGDFPRALADFEAALALQPSSSEALEGIVYVSRRQGHWEESARRHRQLLELDPRNPITLVRYGDTCILLRQYAEADRVYALSASLNPTYGNPWGRRAWLQVVWKGDPQKARAVLDDAARVPGLVDDQATIAISTFRVAMIRGDAAGALQRLEAEKEEA
jgi:tetratricopeptide (TPR) repeat protein